MNRKIHVGIVGTGFIAQTMAKAFLTEPDYELHSICSRNLDTAAAFRGSLNLTDIAIYDHLDTFLAQDGLDMVYVATPTTTRESICTAAIESGKAVLAEKPFRSAESYLRLVSLAEKKGVSFLDATHFVHDPRMQEIQQYVDSGDIGKILSFRSMFSFPYDNEGSIQFNPTLEPKGALSDLGWYPLRACFFLKSGEADLSSKLISKRWNNNTGALIGINCTLEFSDGVILNFDVGYDIGYVKQYIEIIGGRESVYIDDFVIPHNNSFVYNKPHIPHAYTLFKGVDPETDINTVECSQSHPPHHKMLHFFSKLYRNDPEAKQMEARLRDQVIGVLRVMDDIFSQSET
ncbi:hypothetical protein BTA51_03210 [Hahella sp. CCB-MM4]|uniref:Gfo/Idh/MocA family protein n=1 Tax=Hahella sp. (strain CCB-MM4) TaxID=1926491 RepID=UPI000B9B7FD5|nr:Gfo/Idh/MocA family oxidoreductase [Hahella sp. CCB-MM4]OZG75400.1 hypothetical protein BTA51_03210 [Hahella sp. CCB-MM4]